MLCLSPRPGLAQPIQPLVGTTQITLTDVQREAMTTATVIRLQ